MFTWGWQSVGGIALMLLAVVIVHELGHFVTAKRAGIAVEEFAVGFGPRLLSVRRGETIYSLRLIPAGGFVRMAGMTGLEDPAHDGGARGFVRASLGRRALVLVAGGAMNLLLAGALFTVALLVGSPGPQVAAGGGLAAAGLRGSITIAALDGRRVTGVVALRDRLQAGGGRPLRVTVRPYDGGAPRTVTVRPQLRWVGLAARPAIPLEARIVSLDGRAVPHRSPTGLAAALGAGGKILVGWVSGGHRGVAAVAPQRLAVSWEVGYLLPVGNYVMPAFSGPPRALPWAVGAGFLAVPREIGDIFSGLAALIAPHPGGTSQAHLTGPVGIAEATSVATQVSPIAYVTLVGVISLNLGLFNLLPVPFLDGGRLFFVGLEWVRRRRLDPQREAVVHMVGLALILMLAFYATYGDITTLHPGS
ncbi:MAG TPA: site-2 protease family protein [Candidatus Micrarchaeia archaeon]|nr:site-2 protease family protein [Candidatus Micrarchaeia archaeon]